MPRHSKDRPNYWRAGMENKARRVSDEDINDATHAYYFRMKYIEGLMWDLFWRLAVSASGLKWMKHIAMRDPVVGADIKKRLVAVLGDDALTAIPDWR